MLRIDELIEAKGEKRGDYSTDSIPLHGEQALLWWKAAHFQQALCWTFGTDGCVS